VSFAPLPINDSPAYIYDGLYAVMNLVNQTTQEQIVATSYQMVSDVLPKGLHQYSITLKRLSKSCHQKNANFKRKLDAYMTSASSSD